MDPRQSRGYRNRNPGNIEYRPLNKWQGLADPPSDGRFCRFRDHIWGIRALAVLLITYQDRHGLRTIRDVIARFAPAPENDTTAYITAVARRMGRAPHHPLDLHRYDDLRPLVEAIIRHELGGQPYDSATIDEGLHLAGVRREGAEALLHSGTVQAAAGTAAAGVAGITLGEIAAAFAPYFGPLTELVRALGPWFGTAVVVMVALSFIYWRYRRLG